MDDPIHVSAIRLLIAKPAGVCVWAKVVRVKVRRCRQGRLVSES